VWLKDVPAFGYKKYIIRAIDDTITATYDKNVKLLENKWYKIITDPLKGTIIS